MAFRLPWVCVAGWSRRATLGAVASNRTSSEYHAGFVPIGDTLMKRDRIVGCGWCPKTALPKAKGPDNCVRLCLQRPDETVEVFRRRSDQMVTILFDEIRDLLNGVEPKAPI